ncbi:Cell surface protein [Acidisarcina polymorpha]|uniref:Cell surface protein n=1 Tax=Acidisarcina polymorpha TaxID=2211140 RepID=A0A2Z5FW44_9BACT|nr:hypothetical protein [Acidisarcina polymorpha]AXC10960.1 Cell surface protein [Acidisarcina polymorpha]
MAASYGKLPLSFEANHGQTDPQVRFLARGAGYSLFLTNSSAVLALAAPAVADPRRLPDKAANSSPVAMGFTTASVRMELAGATSGRRVEGVDELPGKVNYFVGKGASKWHSNVPTYAKVRYFGVYPGVDLIYYGNQRQLEYDFVVAPNADPDSVKLHFAGTKQLKLAPNGDLELMAKDGEVTFHRPVVYQMTEGKRQAISGAFALAANNVVRFRLGAYDHSRDLIIDPVLVYSTYIGAGGGVGETPNTDTGAVGRLIASTRTAMLT